MKNKTMKKMKKGLMKSNFVMEIAEDMLDMAVIAKSLKRMSRKRR
ncbi:hypothetical protein ACQPU1_08480 [Clostridium paraputrificum]